MDFAKFVEKYIGGDVVEVLRGKANRVDYQIDIEEIVKTLDNHYKSLK